MKKLTKIAAMLLALAMVMSLAVTAFAQNVDSEAGGSATITIPNASKGETYKVYKLFDATVTGDEGGSIAYTGTVPESLKNYFTEDAAGNILVADAAKGQDGSLSAEAVNKMNTWAKEQTPLVSAEADGSKLVFENLTYGYYIVTTTQGSAISVDSTNPNVVIYDKNTKTPDITKDVDDADVDIGQTVTYTATFDTTNWLGTGDTAQQVTKYEITDTLPAFLTNVTITSIIVDNDGALTTTDDQITIKNTDDTVPQFVDKKLTIDWVDADNKSLYDNGAVVVVTYTATVAATDSEGKSVIEVDGTEGNKNEVTLTPYIGETPWDKTWKDSKVIFTYAAALKKVDENSNALAGATFYVNGLTVTGSNGNYTVVSYDSTSTEKGTVMSTDAEGNLIIKGLNSEATLTVYEENAPAGYNKLTAPVTLIPTKIGEAVTVTETKTYYDADGNVTDTETETYTTVIEYNEKLKETALRIENKTGAMLPSTGGMGTTIFYVLGGIMVVAAAALLITKRRMSV